ncbi:MAG: hypothetical protein ACP5KS_02950 [Candidatus Hydrogenedens sp.]
MTERRKKERKGIGKIISTKKHTDNFYDGYIIETSRGKYFLPNSQLNFDVLKRQSENKDKVDFFYMGIINEDQIEDIEVFPFEVLLEIRRKATNSYLQRDIDRLYKRRRLEYEVFGKS